jgi:mannose-1-phosphate guanylyltransferase
MIENTTGTVRFGVILAGGAGERFWPLSRKDRPKQLLCLTDPDHSMLAEAVERVSGVIPRERILVITGAHLVAPIRAAGVGLAPENIVAEPAKRNTAGALVYVTAHILARYPELPPERISIATVTADHRIGDTPLFQRTLDAALTAAETQGALAICGIVPAHPETGFGYIQASLAAPVCTAGGMDIFAVQAFHEKPDRARAEAFIAQGDCFWNSGMFFWRVDTFLSELSTTRPAMAAAVHTMVDALRHGDSTRATAVFEGLEDISIDYALLEQAGRVLMVRGTFPWGDVGLWPALAEFHPHDAAGNTVLGDAVLVGAKNCVVYNNAPGKLAVGIVGVEDLVVVVTDDAVLVVPKDRSGDVREVVAELKRRNAPQT